MTEEKKVYTAEEVYKSILKRIIRLELEPGQLISENQMCIDYGVSRSIIRNAFTKLAQLKFVEVRPQRGTYVTQIDLNYISDLLMLRTSVEKEVIYEMFTKLDESARLELVKKLEKNIEEEEKYIDEKTYSRRFGILDSEFHKTMIDSVNRYALVVILSDIMLHISRWRNFDVKFANRIHELVEEHKNIVKGIKSNDLYKAQECMAAHLETITDIYESAIKQYPKYFIS